MGKQAHWACYGTISASNESQPGLGTWFRD